MKDESHDDWIAQEHMLRLVEVLFRGHYATEALSLDPSAPAADTFQVDSPAELLECTLVAAIVAAEVVEPLDDRSMRDLRRILCEVPFQFVAGNVYRYIDARSIVDTRWKGT